MSKTVDGMYRMFDDHMNGAGIWTQVWPTPGLDLNTYVLVFYMSFVYQTLNVRSHKWGNFHSDPIHLGKRRKT